MQSFTLPPETDSVGAARHRVVDLARESGQDEFVVALVTSELVANVVRHARTDVTVRVRVGPPFRIEVQDGAAASEAFRDLVAAPPDAATISTDGGRGIALVSRFASRIGLDDGPDGGKVVWVEL